MFVLFLFLAIVGYYSWTRLAIDADPDIADTTVQVVTQVPGLAAEEIEQQVCCFVTDCGALETPSATTPLSAAKTTSCFLLSALCTRPVIPASWMESSSSRPRLPGGFASRA